MRMRIGLPVLGLLLAAPALQAQGWYLGASVGVMDNDVPGFDEATNVGVLAGYDVYTKEIFTVSLEAEATTTVSDGDVRAGGASGDWDIDTQAAYFAARLGEAFYLKVRYGVIRRDISASLAGVSRTESDTGGSWSGALGWQLNPRWGVQLDGTMVESDLTYWNLGLNYQFQ